LDILTPEQKKAHAEAIKAAKEAGKKGKDLLEAAASVQFTDEQKTQQAENTKQRYALVRELNKRVMTVLSAEQKGQLKKRAAEVKKKTDR
jgi:hypothetical protein